MYHFEALPGKERIDDPGFKARIDAIVRDAGTVLSVGWRQDTGYDLFLWLLAHDKRVILVEAWPNNFECFNCPGAVKICGNIEAVEPLLSDDALECVCFPPQTLIKTKTGYQPIQTIKIGDEVLTHKGRFKAVRQLYERFYEGDLVSFHPAYLPNAIHTTPNHPILGQRNYSCPRGSTRLCQPECKEQWAKYDRRGKLADAVLIPNCSQGYENYKLTWLRAGELAERDIVVSRSVSPAKIDVLTIDLARIIEGDYEITDLHIRPRNPRGKTIPRFIITGSEFWRLAGYYLAEGHVTRTIVAFSFHSKEVEYIDDVDRLMQKFFGLHGTLRLFVDSLGAQISFCSKVAAQTFSHLFGAGAANKKLPMCALDVPASELFSAFIGLWRGDGTINPDSFRIVSLSRELLCQMRDLLLKFGAISSLGRHHRSRNDAYILSVGGAGLDRLRDLGLLHLFTRNRIRGWNQDGWSDGEKLYAAIRNLNRYPYQGMVYNLGVEEDNSYVAEDIVVHNCWQDGPEHMEMDRARALIRRIQSRARSMVLASPNGEQGQDALDGNEWEIHRSTWNIDTYQELGFDVIPYEAGLIGCWRR